MSDIQAALTALELREAELLSWGAVGAQWTREEVMAVLAEHGDGEALFADLEQRGLLVRTPTHGYRTRSAETMRLLATLRQAFRGDRILNGRPLVLDFRFLQRPRRRPRRDIDRADFVDALGDAVRRPRQSHRCRVGAADALGLPAALHRFNPDGPELAQPAGRRRGHRRHRQR